MDQVLEIIKYLIYLILGGAVVYLKFSETAQKKLSEITATAVKLIKEAEETFQSTTTSGEEKFEMVVDKLHSLIPKPLNIIITESMIREIVQSTFDEMKSYACTKLDESINKLNCDNISNEDNTKDDVNEEDK